MPATLRRCFAFRKFESRDRWGHRLWCALILPTADPPRLPMHLGLLIIYSLDRYVWRRTDTALPFRYVCAQDSSASAVHTHCATGRRNGSIPRTARGPRIQGKAPCPIPHDIRQDRSAPPLTATNREASAVRAQRQLPVCSAVGELRSWYSPCRSPLGYRVGISCGAQRTSTSNRNSIPA